MTSIYRKELRSYFTNLHGYIFGAFMLLICGIFFYAVNLKSLYPNFEYALETTSFIFLLVVPIVTMKCFAEEKGHTDLFILDSYRSYEDQERVYLSKGSEIAAVPGHSEHHTGLAMDFSLYFPDGTSADFNGEGEWAWITENAHRFGLILRYPEGKAALTGIAYEPWHFRYVGVPHAAAMQKLGMCLEEYHAYLRTFPYEGEHLFLTLGADRYEIWFERGSDAHLPIEGEYTVSGNNVDGLIITRKLLDGNFTG